MILHIPLRPVCETFVGICAMYGPIGLVQNLFGLLKKWFNLLHELVLVTIIFILGLKVFNVLQADH